MNCTLYQRRIYSINRPVRAVGKHFMVQQPACRPERRDVQHRQPDQQGHDPRPQGVLAVIAHCRDVSRLPVRHKRNQTAPRCNFRLPRGWRCVNNRAPGRACGTERRNFQLGQRGFESENALVCDLGVPQFEHAKVLQSVKLRKPPVCHFRVGQHKLAPAGKTATMASTTE